MTVSDLPLFNASLNAASAVLISCAFVAIKKRKIRTHAALMITAVTCSVIFLVSYVIYHVRMGEKSSGLPSGMFKTVYLIMLASHVLLAIMVLPMIVMVVTRAAKREWPRHRKLARPTFWIWLYVSVTGVIVYLVLYHIAPAMYPKGIT